MAKLVNSRGRRIYKRNKLQSCSVFSILTNNYNKNSVSATRIVDLKLVLFFDIGFVPVTNRLLLATAHRRIILDVDVYSEATRRIKVVPISTSVLLAVCLHK